MTSPRPAIAPPQRIDGVHHPVVIIRRSGWALVSLMLLIFLGILGWTLRGSSPTPLYRANAAPRPIAPAGCLDSDEQQAVQVFQAAAPSVVGVTAMRDDSAREDDIGAGVIWHRDGYIVTNVHLVNGAAHILVRLLDGTTWPARMVGCDFSNDIALVKIEAPRECMPPLPLGTSRDLMVGQKVYAIGSPFGLDHTLTSGILSGRNREILSTSTQLPIYGVLQTDAAINPGNSGGPLLDSSGRMVGLNTAVAGRAGTSVGVGFAVPSDTLNRIVPELMRQGRPDRAGLGITLDPDGRSNRLFGERFNTTGVVVFAVQAGSAAAKAGLRPTRVAGEYRNQRVEGDLIRAIDGVAIHGPNDLRRALEAYRAGETIQLGVTRWQNERASDLLLSVCLQAIAPEGPTRRPAQATQAPAPAQSPRSVRTHS